MRRLIIALVVLAVAGGIAVWRLRSRAPQNPGVPPATTDAAAGGIPTPAADLVLQVNGGARVDVTSGTPVFFTVSLTGTAPGPSIRIATTARPWFAGLRFETADEKPFAPRVDQLGPAVAYLFDEDPRTPMATAAEQTNALLVDASRVHQVELGLSPDEAARLTAGSYDVRAVLSLTTAAKGEIRVTSNAVTITVATAATAQPSPAEEKRRLESTAHFYLRSEKWEDAHRIAVQLVGREGAGAEAHILLADALNGLRRDEEALAAYYEAAARLPAPKESPDYLIARMESVRQRLEASKAKKE